ISYLLSVLAVLLGLALPVVAQTIDTSAKKAPESAPVAAGNASQAEKTKSDAATEAKLKNKKAKPKPSHKLEPRPGPVVHNLAAIKTIFRVIEDSVDLGPTLVVWLIDRTTSAHDIAGEVTDAAQTFYSSALAAAWSAAANQPLVTSIVGFDDKTHF